jgi:hypothetical protein
MGTINVKGTPLEKLKTAMKLLSLSDKSYCIMGAAQIREELHEFINRADDRVLSLIYGMMKADLEQDTLTTQQREDLDKRVARHKKGESKSYSWPESRNKIEKRG